MSLFVLKRTLCGAYFIGCLKMIYTPHSELEEGSGSYGALGLPGQVGTCSSDRKESGRR